MAFTRIGYGQVEANQLSAQKTGQIYASLPLNENVKVLQNGEFMYYDYKSGMVSATGVGEPMLVFNEIKIYEDWLALKDFAMIRVGDNYVTNNPAVGRLTSENTDGTVYGGGSLTKGVNPVIRTTNEEGEVVETAKAHTEYPYRMAGIAPRLLKTNIGDIFTTNMVDEKGTYAQGDTLGLKVSDRNTLVLCPVADATITTVQFVIAKDYTMPDGQRGLKLQRIQ